MSDFIAKELSTPPPDRKFFNSTNQAHYCWQKYNEYVLCVKKTSDEEACLPKRFAATSVCIDEWVKAWDEARENGTFLGVQEKSKTPSSHH